MIAGPTSLYLNDTDLARIGLAVERVEGLRGIGSRRYASAPVPGTAGLALLDGRPLPTSRTVVITATAIGDTFAGLLSLLDILKNLLGSGVVELRATGATDRVLSCRLVDLSSDGVGLQFVERGDKVRIVLEALHPAWEDRAPYIATPPIPGGLVDCPVGTWPSAPVIRIGGAAVNPTVTLKNAAGDTVASMGFTVTLAATDYLEIDCRAKTITKYASAVASDGIALLTSGDFLVLSPEDGDFERGLGPSLTASAGTLVAYYRRNWT